MEFIKGQERILYFKLDGFWLPIGCLTDNSFSESSEVLDTTTLENDGWLTQRATNQSYSISFNGLQTVSLGVISYLKLKQIKRSRLNIKWKLEGSNFSLTDYGNCIITELSEAAPIDEFITFSGTAQGFGMPKLQEEDGFFAIWENSDNIILQNNDQYIYNG